MHGGRGERMSEQCERHGEQGWEGGRAKGLCELRRRRRAPPAFGGRGEERAERATKYPPWFERRR